MNLPDIVKEVREIIPKIGKYQAIEFVSTKYHIDMEIVEEALWEAEILNI